MYLPLQILLVKFFGSTGPKSMEYFEDFMNFPWPKSENQAGMAFWNVKDVKSYFQVFAALFFRVDA